MSAEAAPVAVVGRFAPSPTGPLHVGSLVAALGSYLMARQAGGRWLLRMEDLDHPRVLPGVADDQLRTLEALGFSWDGPVLYQSDREAAYRGVLEELLATGRVYPCGCSRAEIARSASAPHGAEPRYPGTCRDGLPPGREPRAYRLKVPVGEVSFVDLLQGACAERLDGGDDFVVKRADGPFAYQLAVVVDDQFQGVNQVVRGADLLASTYRQLVLQHLLGYPTPAYGHLPLVTAPDGAKLSKRDATVSLATAGDLLRQGGSLLCRALLFLGQAPPRELSIAPPADVLAWALAHFRPAAVPRQPGTFPSY